MNYKLLNKISNKYKNYSIIKLDSGASKKKIYKLYNDENSYIIIDFKYSKMDFINYIKIYNILIKTNISIPKIIEKNEDDQILILQDFGNLRFDKILNNYSLKKILNYAVKTLIIINNSIKFDKNFEIPQYNFKIFNSEIIELPKYYLPYKNINSNDLEKEFIYIWSKAFNNIDFDFTNFIHKDFNFNNLLLLPSKKDHLKCGVIDFQSAFWGDNTWDLFSLLEDSRLLFSDKYNDYYINLYYSNTKNNVSFNEFKMKYYFLNSSRQTRLLGRWVKLSKDLKKDWYLDFIPITLNRLRKNINLTQNENLINFYNKYILRDE